MFAAKDRLYTRLFFLSLLAALLIYRIFFDRGVEPTIPRHVLTQVHDGDTVTISGYGRCRLFGIDTPELWEYRDNEWRKRENLVAHDYLASDWLKNFTNREVRVILRGKDTYDRWLIDLYLPNATGEINAADYIRAQKWEKTKKRLQVMD